MGRIRRLVLTLLAAGALGYGGLCWLVYARQDALIFFPDRHLSADPSRLGLTYEEFELASGPSATVHGWVVRTEPSAPWILHCHGNGGNISGRIDELAVFHQLGLNAVVFDYRGYGKSSGQPSEQGITDDAEAVRNYLVDQLKAEKLVYFGESLGGGVACALAERHPPAGLILKSTFTSVPDVAAEVYPFLPVRWLARVRFPSRQRVARFPFPKLILHGDPDEVIPFHHGRDLFEAAAEPKQFVQIGPGHNTPPDQLGEDYLRAVSEFCQAL
ncbi:MAG: alpha/beta hydrolase [Vulcanimicrobiota bacterium]